MDYIENILKMEILKQNVCVKILKKMANIKNIMKMVN